MNKLNFINGKPLLKNEKVQPPNNNLILDIFNKKHCNYSIYDHRHNQLPFVQRYDIKKQEVSMFISRPTTSPTILHGIDGVPILVTFILKGSYAKDPQGNIIIPK